MYKVLIAGAGKIGSLIACLLAESNDYEVHLADLHFTNPDVKRLLKIFPNVKTATLDVKNAQIIEEYLTKYKIYSDYFESPLFFKCACCTSGKKSKSTLF